MAGKDIRLVVQADDFGMCHAINVGIVDAFLNGIVTQAALMVPCPWFDEAAALAHAHAIPVGLHCTLTGEWEHLRWRPLTAGTSLAETDGTLHRTLDGAVAAVDDDEAIAELEAQAARLLATGLMPICCDPHMGVVSTAACTRVCALLGVPFLYPVIEPAVAFDSQRMLSHHEPDKLAWLLRYLDGLEPGAHYLCTHPGTPGPELAAMTRADAGNADFAERFRASDLAVLTDPAVRTLIDARGIELVTAADIAVDVAVTSE
ncbi:MAG TPA: ChbG/HpnK family deacetylase [Pseudomonadales bacterium]|nr:ChbG/HpnK family deacetylase [Pseudomonadales bacterium]